MKTRLCLMATIAVMAATLIPVHAGFNEWGYNYTARLFNGWLGQWQEYAWHRRSGIPEHWTGWTDDAYLVMKWSKDWIPQADEPVGAWCTNHWTWYSNDYEEGTWYGWNSRVTWTDPNVAPSANYKIVEFLKVMKVGNDQAQWAVYEAGGAYTADWGTYASGVPKYVVFQDVIEVYDVATGLLVNTFNLCTASPKGLGQPIF